ncbi:MAG: ABC transporter ATP-binding protein [Deltaproteobacteria bacterium]|nr:ABC transporter ATP-binding protein [Deltaproteobacteria bacterium]MBW2122630.1 ABC transporter ATP-binding protein [Deltaproteobacteria bacterium]
MAFLEIDQVHKHFGGIPALDGVSLTVEEGKIHGVIGPNGAGKTTMFNVINGVYSPDRGTVRFRGRDITGLKPNQIASMGIGRTFQVARIFNEMTLMENMMVPVIPKRLSKKEGEEKALELLEMADLAHLKDQLAIEISGGQKKLLEFMRTMMADPEVVLLDEPFAGVNPALIERLIEITFELNRTRGKTFLLISHDIPSVMKLCKYLTVLSAGKSIAEGESEKIRHDPAVIDAYLGH